MSLFSILRMKLKEMNAIKITLMRPKVYKISKNKEES